MGLHYDPFQSSIDEARAFLARIRRSDPSGENDDDDEFGDHMLHRSRRDWPRSVVLSAEAPPMLVWEEVLREDPFFRGNWIEAHKKIAHKVNESLGDGRRLRGWLRAMKERSDFATIWLSAATTPE